jgi:hypothetical protein
MPTLSADRQVAQFIARYDPAVARVARAARAKLRRLLPGTIELVYDNFNALAIGWSPTERASDVIASIALYPRWVNFFLLKGARLRDPEGLLQGSGSRVRHVVLEKATVLDQPALRSLLKAATALSPAVPPGQRRRTIVKAVSARQRPRRPPSR